MLYVPVYICPPMAFLFCRRLVAGIGSSCTFGMELLFLAALSNAIRVLFVVVLALPIAVTAQVQTLVIGEGGVDWVESIE